MKEPALRKGILYNGIRKLAVIEKEISLVPVFEGAIKELRLQPR